MNDRYFIVVPYDHRSEADRYKVHVCYIDYDELHIAQTIEDYGTLEYAIEDAEDWIRSNA